MPHLQDPLGLGQTASSLERFTEGEIINGRFAMLGVAGMVGVEVLGFGNWYDAPLWVSRFPLMYPSLFTHADFVAAFVVRVLLPLRYVNSGGGTCSCAYTAAETVPAHGCADSTTWRMALSRLAQQGDADQQNGALGMLCCGSRNSSLSQHSVSGSCDIAVHSMQHGRPCSTSPDAG